MLDTTADTGDHPDMMDLTVDMGELTTLAKGILETTVDQYRVKGPNALPLWVSQYFDAAEEADRQMAESDDGPNAS
eukprot:8578093-Pyramimonas_sp.AAC.1